MVEGPIPSGHPNKKYLASSDKLPAGKVQHTEVSRMPNPKRIINLLPQKGKPK
jgi:hypothetical protein